VRHCVPTHYASVFIHPVIRDAMTKTNALSLVFVMYILCCRSVVQSRTIIINVGMLLQEHLFSMTAIDDIINFSKIFHIN